MRWLSASPRPVPPAGRGAGLGRYPGRRLALVLALSLAPAVALGKDSRKELVKQLRADYAAADWPKAIDTARRLVALEPGAAGGWYDLACMQSRGGQGAEAVESLRQAAERGFDLVATFLRDADLDPIRPLPGFAAAEQAIRANNARSVVAFRQRAEREARMRIVPRRGGDPKEPAALVVALHGRGGDAASFVAAFEPVARALDAVLAVPEGMEKLPDGGFGWGKVEEGEQLVLLAIERAGRGQRIDPGRIVVVGFSQGGATAMAVGLRHPRVAAGIVVVASGDDPRVYAVPDLPPAQIPRFALIVGGEDPEAGPTGLLARRLQAEGVRVGLRVEPGLGHDLPRDRVRVIGNAIRYALGERDSLTD